MSLAWLMPQNHSASCPMNSNNHFQSALMRPISLHVSKKSLDHVTVLDCVAHHQNGCIMLGRWNRLSHWHYWLATGVNTGVKILRSQANFNMIATWVLQPEQFWALIKKGSSGGSTSGGLHRKMGAFLIMVMPNFGISIKAYFHLPTITVQR